MIQVLPPDEMKEIVIKTAVEAGIPGCSEKSLYDARPHLRSVVDSLYIQGFALVRLIDSPKSQQIAAALTDGKAVTIK